MKILLLLLILQACTPEASVFYPNKVLLNNKEVLAEDYKVEFKGKLIVFHRGEARRTALIVSEQQEQLATGELVEIHDCEEFYIKVYSYENTIYKIEASTTEAKLVLIRKALE